MSTFIVSARKYRPTRFADVVGQEHVSKTLKNAFQTDHLAHAFLFCGPRGVGKTTCARILAKVLNCQNITDDFEPCNTCSACKAFNQNASFNITELDAASNNSVEHIRALIEQVRFQPQQGKYKVFIIDEVHMLSQQAFNAFLKTLEEPPSYAIFILATTEKHKIIPTILSRCQIFDFKRIQVPRIVAHLQGICEAEQIEADYEALHIIAQKADGALRDALSIFDRIVSFSGNKITYEDVITNLNVLDYDYFFRVVDALLVEDVASILTLFDDIQKKGFDGDLFMNGLAEHLRNILVCKDKVTLPLLNASDSLQSKYEAQANKAPVSFLVTALDLANECDIHFKTARNKRLHVEMALIKMTYINRAIHASHQLATTDPEKKNPDLTEQGFANADNAEELNKDITIAEDPTLPLEEGGEEEEVVEASSDELIMNKSMDLSALMAEVEADHAKQTAEAIELTLENLNQAWQDYITSIDRDTIKIILRQASLSFEGVNVIARVGSALSENTVRQESGLMDFLREQLKNKALTLTIEVDKSLAPPAPKKKEILTPKQIYLKMGEENPLLHDLRKKFDLRPD